MRTPALHRFLLALACAVAFVMVSTGEARADWDLERIGAVKQAAEAAYDAEDYVEASRHYIELRGLLKDALEQGQVPEAMIGSAESALVASTYQLGRTNQLSDNCDGAATVYGELLKEPAADAALRGRAWARLAEAQACIVVDAAEASNHKRARAALVAANSAIASLEAAVVGPLVDDEDLVALQREVFASVDAATDAALVSIDAEVDRALGQRRCDELDQLLRFGSTEYPSRDWSAGEGRAAECRKALADNAEPVEDLDSADSYSVPWWPGLLVVAAGGATLIGTAAFDAGLVDEIDTYELVLDDCNGGDIEACKDARSRLSNIESQQEIIVALYVTGSIVTVMGATYTIVTAVLGDESESIEASPTPRVDLAPRLEGGGTATLTWTF